MQGWHCKDLGNGVAASAPSMRIQRLFPPMFLEAGRPSDMAVFSRHDRRANTVTVYFSPRALHLAALFEALPCDKPSSEGIGLLVGAQRSWGIHFPDKKRRAA